MQDGERGMQSGERALACPKGTVEGVDKAVLDHT